MTFNIHKSNGNLLVSVPDGAYNSTVSSLILFGKNFANYGTALNENLVHIMENFSSGESPTSPLEGQLWFDTVNQELKIWSRTPQNTLTWQLINANSLQNIAESIVPNRLYVSKSGNDSNSGLSWFNAKRTIKSACDAARVLIATNRMEPEHVTILVASGDYEENCPISVPEGVSIIGDNLRSVTVRPLIATTDVFHLESQTYMFGITVRGHSLSPSALDITPTTNKYNASASGADLPRNTVQTGFAFAFAPNALIRVSPYIQNCSSISGDPFTDSGNTPGGGGVLVDGNSIDPTSRIHSIVVDAFTQINLGGIGVKVVGKGYMQLVSFFVNFCQFGLLCVDGGHVTALNSNCSFGNYALWAEGYRFLDNQPVTDSAGVTAPGSVNQTWFSNGVDVSFVSTPNYRVYPDQVGDLMLLINDTVDSTYQIISVTDSVSNNTEFVLNQSPPSGSTVTIKTKFGSLIEASGYTMSYAGAGLDYTKLSASQGGVGRADPNKYTITYPDDPLVAATSSARIYHTTTDEGGDFYVGVVTPGDIDNTGAQSPGRPSFRINQRRGVIDGRAFYQSIFGFMAPFVLALTRRNK